MASREIPKTMKAAQVVEVHTTLLQQTHHTIQPNSKIQNKIKNTFPTTRKHPYVATHLTPPVQPTPKNHLPPPPPSQPGPPRPPHPRRRRLPLPHRPHGPTQPNRNLPPDNHLSRRRQHRRCHRFRRPESQTRRPRNGPHHLTPLRHLHQLSWPGVPHPVLY